MSDVSQCPRCELRFPNRVELESHLSLDHPGAVRKEDEAVDDDTDRLGRDATARPTDS
jgi:hypothetical protein